MLFGLVCQNVFGTDSTYTCNFNHYYKILLYLIIQNLKIMSN